MKTALLTILILITGFSCIYSQVAVNEFLADPEDPLESEWIELYNYSDYSVDLSDWQICDLIDCTGLPDVSIESLQYAVICQDSAAFLTYYSDFEGMLYQLNGWRQLNNGGDQLVFLDQDGNIIDSTSYQSGNGGNISWERIDPFSTSNDSLNWHQCIDSSGSTPGQINSVVYGFSSYFDISLRNKVFSPGCGCSDELLEFTLEMQRECALTLTVFDMDGREVVVIYDNRYLTSGSYTYDGRDNGGDYLKVGMYILLAVVEGECSGKEKLVFGVAKK